MQQLNHTITLRILLSFFIIIIGNSSQAQGPGGGNGQGRAGGGQGRPTAGVFGKVIDSKSNNPIPYATVALYKAKDSSLVSGTITKEDGRFIIQAKTGKYYLEINFMGYNKIRKSNVNITAEKPMYRIGAVKLAKSNAEIQGVEIVGEQSYVDYKIDRKVINVERDLASSGASAVEALQNVPSVTVDIEGNVALRGSSNFTVLINGKPSPLSGGDALEQIPTSAIKNIEIITNPSAKFDPDGMTGIINVILKDDVNQGFNGIIETNGSSTGSYGFNTTLNYRTEKWNFFGGVDIRNRNSPGDGLSEMQNFANPDTTFYRTTNIDRQRMRDNMNFKAGVDYYANDKNTFGVEGVYGINQRGKDYFSEIDEYYDPLYMPHVYTTSANETHSDQDFIKTNLSWLHKFKNKGEKLDVLVYFNTRSFDKEDDQKESFSNADWNPNMELISWTNTMDKNDNTDIRVKADYTKLLSKERKFEAGIQSRSKRESSVFTYDEYNLSTEKWENQALYNNNMDFNRDILSIYSTYGGMFKNFGYQLGLRGEYTNRQITSGIETNNSDINRFDIFPTVHLSQKINDKNSVMASYSRRIDRPGGWELNPNITFISSNFKREGNTGLEPEYTDSYELNYQLKFSKSFLSLEGYYRTTKNKISRIQEMDPTTYITTMTFANLDQDHATGIEAMANLQLNKWLRFNVSGNYYYYKLEGNLTSGAVDTESINFDVRGNANILITPLMRLQLTTFYRGPSVTAQGESESFYMFNTALRYDFFQRKLSVTLKASNITNSMKHAFSTYTSTFSTSNEFNRVGPVFSLTATYKINNYKQKRKASMEDGGGDGGDI